MNNRVLTKDFTVFISPGRTVTSEVTAELVYEADYGADADGNRGIGVWFVEGLQLSYIGRDDNEETLDETQRRVAEYLLYNKAELYDWEDELNECGNEE
jgi:hypothetical protein